MGHVSGSYRFWNDQEKQHNESQINFGITALDVLLRRIGLFFLEEYQETIIISNPLKHCAV